MYVGKLNSDILTNILTDSIHKIIMNHGDAIFYKSDLMVIWVQLLVDPSQLIVQYRLTKSVFIHCVFHPEMNSVVKIMQLSKQVRTF